MNKNIASLYEFTLQQMAAESYLEGPALSSLQQTIGEIGVRFQFPITAPVSAWCNSWLRTRQATW